MRTQAVSRPFPSRPAGIMIFALCGAGAGLACAGAVGAPLQTQQAMQTTIAGDHAGDYAEVMDGALTIAPGAVLGADGLGTSLRQSGGYSVVGSGAQLTGGIEMTGHAATRLGVGAGPQAKSYRLAMADGSAAHLDNIWLRSLPDGATSANGGTALDLRDNAAVTMGANTRIQATVPLSDGMELVAHASAIVDGSRIEGTMSGVQAAGAALLSLHRATLIGGAQGLVASQQSLVTVSGGQIASLGTTSNPHGDVDSVGLFAISGGPADAPLSVDVSGHAVIQAKGARSAGLLAEAIDAPIEVSVRDSVIQGDHDGIVVNMNPVLSGGAKLATLDVAGTQVVSGDGAAIRLGRGAKAAIALSRNALVNPASGVALLTGAGSEASVTVENAAVNGRAVNQGGTSRIALGANGVWRGGMSGVDSLTVNAGGLWALDGSSDVGQLAMNGGTVNLNGGSQAHVLSARTLSGHGNFLLKTDLAGHAGDQLAVSGLATGSHVLTVADTGRAVADPKSLQVVRTGGGDAGFSLANGAVDLGVYRYRLQRDGFNWNLVPLTTGRYSASATSVLNLISASPVVWYGQERTLRSRLGELRFDRDRGGAWVRPYAGDYRILGVTGAAFQQRQSGIALGADKALPLGGGKAYVGGVFNYSHAELDDHAGASGAVDAYSVGLYGVWLAQNGAYLHGLASLNRYQNQGQATMSNGVRAKGSYRQNGVGASLEAGRRFALPRDWFVQPYAQLAGVRMNGATVALDNGMLAQADHADSIQGSVGASLGRGMHAAKGGVVEPYVRLAVTHEFVKNNSVRVNGQPFDANLNGSRVEIGAGVSAEIGKRLSGHLDYAYAKGPRLEKPFMLDAGIRYQW
ncbi:autotransporter outer membrane beta-barrel domain-containing protein [Chromobacterium violaceum]|uniref:autotransporter outer membrane beta-barrel domain-containing protein n=1 Tax=Chromobacterium violaceum TaxID=536 RepID=UPI0009B9FC57|nr:autotransporter outer membrane beta-barrel domain-containing protein [Chromobacterium violaceum]